MANRIQIRRDSQSNWNSIDPVLADGELALTYDNNQIKIGDGANNWSSLSYTTPSFATVATSGSYNDLSNLPSVPETLMDLISSYSPSNNRQFLRFKSADSSIEFSSDFRVVPYSGVVYPGGTLGSDVAGDIAFDDSGIYYCYQTPNSYSVNYSGSTGWVPAGWIKLDSRGPGSGPQVGDKLTDGIYTSTVASIEATWTGTLMLINISPAISSWKNGSGSLTVYTGTEPHLKCWARLSTEIVSAPAHNNSVGIIGQIAYDTGYMYRCTQSTVTEISATYKTPKFTSSGYNNQGGLTNIRVNNDGVVATPQVGWTVYDIDTSSSRVITTVSATTGESGSIWILSYTGDLDFGSVTQVRLISQEAVDAVWKRVALSADTW